MSEIDETWRLLEAQTLPDQESRRRLIPESHASVFLVLNGQSKVRTLRFELASDLGVEGFPKSAGVHLHVREINEQKFLLEVSLTQDDFREIFDVLVHDMVEVANSAPSESAVGLSDARRILHWQSFFRVKNEGLSKERVRGLFGELKVLQWIGGVSGWDKAVEAWVGPLGAAQDFHLGKIAFETKASSAKSPQEIRISSERQLDLVGLDHLYVWHYSVDERNESGETLGALIFEIRNFFSESTKREDFELLLRMSGYFDEHAHRYPQGFTLRKRSIFEVREGFPRIVEADCPPGLGDVKYSIQVGAVSDFEVSQDAVLEMIPHGNN